MNRYLFVYGTLRRGPARTHRLLGDARFVAKGSVCGKLFDLGQYPGLRRAPRGQGRVGGEVYELTDADTDRRLAILDRYEGAEFRRARVMVRLQNGRQHRAWAYVLADKPPKGTQPIATGVYRKSGGRRLQPTHRGTRLRRASAARRG